MQIFDVLFQEYELFLMKQNIDVCVHKSVGEFIVDQASCDAYGARELQRVMEQHIIDPLADMIVKKEVYLGDELEILVCNKKIVFEIQKYETRVEETLEN